MTLTAHKFIACTLLLLSGVPLWTQASVVMTGTRIIYLEGTREKVLQLSNKDDHPNLVQLWMDDGNNQSSPSKSDVPFTLTPQIFRMEPQSGQVVRLSYLERNLPKDRESVFYLNFLQIPALKADKQTENKLVLIVNNRLKVFYRPAALKENVDTLGEKIQVTLDSVTGDKIKIHNPTGYFISLRDAKLINGDKTISFATSEMFAPNSTTDLALPAGVKAKKGELLTLNVVNDYGTNIPCNYHL
ncbi:fimbrial biogenesis chaperone [Yersinia mollaretii]|uniref:Gram-negative pili assembly chaperone n=1 Tax=Yersinia mollaretii (strain ATCC 43969 / DSM 18520 / CIP 103324 / CNY 7263 / WAIP 204) TaxID=349967 RepID=A0ABP2EIB8_YERMW|nr:molecular chaperone [Yersinia mollaretii]EEQ12214.1 Gram-negative pili assembly chaperone [Yersinia mollaretii ATCC 43969]MDN0110691.1 molecular chaperone [Yersinia mollaretii]PJE88587.1 molecular chaperone [Yersinia mollaretii]QKJ03901.1 molecular chaperone [Yersinia mollaretii ATCC 43969]CQD32718.1 pili assembly chaperone [Yersinia mollaretii]